MGVGGGLRAPCIPWVGVSSWKVGFLCALCGGDCVKSVMLPVVDGGAASAIGVDVPPIFAWAIGVTCGNILCGGESTFSVGGIRSSSVSPSGTAPGSGVSGALLFFLGRNLSLLCCVVCAACLSSCSCRSISCCLSARAASIRDALSISIANLCASSCAGGVTATI